MAAKVEIHSFHGSGPTPTDFTVVATNDDSVSLNDNIMQDGVLFLRADSDTHTPESEDYLPIPSTTETFSWRKSLAFYVKKGTSDAPNLPGKPTPDGTAYITNVKVYFVNPPPTIDDNDVTGWQGQVKLYASNPTVFNYVQASVADENAQVVGTVLVDDPNAPNDVPSTKYDKSHPIDLLNGYAPDPYKLVGFVYEDSYSGNSDPSIRLYLVLQMGILPTCKSGAKATRTITFRYDEV